MTKKIRWHVLPRLLAVFALAVCVAGFGPACLLIECNIQRTVTGRVEPGITFSLEEGMPVLTDTVSGNPMLRLSDEKRQGVAVLLPPSLRLLGTLWREELAAASRLWELVAERGQPSVD